MLYAFASFWQTILDTQVALQYGILDTGYRHDLSVDEAHDLAKKSIYHATFRDGASGGRVSGEIFSSSSFHLLFLVFIRHVFSVSHPGRWLEGSQHHGCQGSPRVQGISRVLMWLWYAQSSNKSAGFGTTSLNN